MGEVEKSMSEFSELVLTLSEIYLEDEVPFTEVQDFSSVYGDFSASVGALELPEMEVISSGEVNFRQAMRKLTGLRRIKKKTGKLDLELFNTWAYTGVAERDHDVIYLTIKKGQTPVQGFDRVKLSRQQVMDEISAFKKRFLEMAARKSSERQAEELWESITNEYVDESKNNFWNW